MLKKGQFFSPWKVEHIIKKIESTGNKKILITERGNSFGFDNLIADMRSIPIMQEETGYPVIFDGTHSAQMPGNAGETTGGLRKYIPTMVKCCSSCRLRWIYLWKYMMMWTMLNQIQQHNGHLDQLENLLIQIKHIQ